MICKKCDEFIAKPSFCLELSEKFYTIELHTRWECQDCKHAETRIYELITPAPLVTANQE